MDLNQSTAFHTKIKILKRRPGVEERAVQGCAAAQRQIHGGAIHTQDLSSCQQGNRHLVAQIVGFPHVFSAIIFFFITKKCNRLR